MTVADVEPQLQVLSQVTLAMLRTTTQASKLDHQGHQASATVLRSKVSIQTGRLRRDIIKCVA